ncbi:MAG: DNA primase [Peptoniphilaceae bacterium]|nr:DNA primase [Peptoniphilaceae bacterium]MDD7383524.1 DNA primase [Peptoniphilaceae bacterium]MDY3738697.1 DNA primase [Peptoniphilaceae bacterium]
MFSISEEKKNQILEIVDIVSVIGDYVNLKKSGRGYMGLCPFHKEKTPSFTVSEDKQLFHCFGCGAGGDVISFIEKIEGLDYVNALKFLADKAGIILEEESVEHKKISERKSRLYDINKDICMFFYKNLLTEKRPQSYLKMRGLKPNLVNKYMLGYAKDSYDDLLNYCRSKNYLLDDLIELGLIGKNTIGNLYDKFRDRIIFPIFNIQNKIIGFGGRNLTDKLPKYLNSPENIIFKKRENLYSLNNFRNQDDKRLLLVEGYMDVIGLSNVGIDSAVASLGTSLTLEQAKLIERYSKDIYICYDSDMAGIKATDRAIDIFNEIGKEVKVVELEDGMDPDEFVAKKGFNSFEKKIEDAQDIYNYRFSKILKKYQDSKPNEKLEKLNLFLDFLAKIDSAVTMEIFANKVSDLFKINKTTLIEEVNKVKNRKSIIKREQFKSNNYKKENNNLKFESIQINDYSPNLRIENEINALSLILYNKEFYYINKKLIDNFIKNKDLKIIKDSIINSDISEITDNNYKSLIKRIEKYKNMTKNEIHDLIERIKLFTKKDLNKKIMNHQKLSNDDIELLNEI